LIVEQRIKQFYIVPDLLTAFSPSIGVRLYFGRKKVPPGTILPCADTTTPPTLHLQVFDDKPRLLTVVVMDPDVPLPTQDRFGSKLHFLAANIPWSGAAQDPPLMTLKSLKEPDGQLAVPWLPPYSQKGVPYHRLSVFVLEQPDQQPLDLAALKARYGERKKFTLKSIMQVYKLKPIGFSIFRTVWDPTTEAVMKEHDIPGWDIEFKPQRWKSLKPPRKARGWEAKRQSAKFKHLWKYTKRIASGKGKGPR
jgi:large subunit ribosomal protein L35